MRITATLILLFVLPLLPACSTGTQLPTSRAYPTKDPELVKAVDHLYKTGERPGLAATTPSSVEVYRFSGRTRHYIGVVAWDRGKAGDFVVFEYDSRVFNEPIRWIAKCEQMPAEPRVIKIKPVNLMGMQGPCLEVFAADEQGHGHLYLYHLDLAKRELELVLKTFAVDSSRDEYRIRDDTLSPVYYMPTRFQTVGNVVIVGIVDQYDPSNMHEDDPMPIAARRVHQVHVWDAGKRRFTTDPERWQGMSPYEELQ